MFDPTSVEVELNPNVFRDQEIEYVHVASLCGVRKGVKHYDNDEYRKAFGMEVNKVLTPMAPRDMSLDTAADDYFHELQDKPGSMVTYADYDKKGNNNFNLRGRGKIGGTDNYLIEPILLGYVWEQTDTRVPDKNMILPAYEIKVTVSIKLKGFDAPLVYTRSYLPEIKILRMDDAMTIYSQMKERLEQVKKDPIRKVSAPILEYQVSHFREKCVLARPNFDDQGTFYYKNARFSSDTWNPAPLLFDGDYTTKCQMPVSYKENGMWTLTFETSRSITPKQYKLVTSPQTRRFNGECNPKEWALFGQNSSGQWVELDRRNGGNIPEDKLPEDDMVGKNYTLNRNHGTFEKFMFVVYSFFGYDSFWEGLYRKCDWLELAELQLSELDPVVFTFEKSTGGEPGGYEGKNLIDDDHVSEWHCPNSKDGKWFVEFKASRPISPISYYFITGNDSGEHWQRTPKAWELYGKKNQGDEWTVLSDLDFDRDGSDAHVPGSVRQKSSTFKFNKQKPSDMQYFRLEITSNFGSNAVQLNELVFNY